SYFPGKVGGSGRGVGSDGEGEGGICGGGGIGGNAQTTECWHRFLEQFGLVDPKVEGRHQTRLA
ncbi:MAG TPA: hypothetical protein DEO44_01465, partial [Verrucomicrobia subdivision 6 bacterium]|nr:hypothetical protein [Verrucomicrobia subdivision 6 bacterium]